MYVSSLLYIFDCLKRVCEYNTLFCVWSILVLDKHVGSPLRMTCLIAVGRKLILPPFLWNLSSSPILSHPLFSHCDDRVLVMFQPPRHCFACVLQPPPFLQLSCTQMWASWRARWLLLSSWGTILLFASESSALPIALASICLTIPCICCHLLFDLCFSVPATPALLFNFGCRTSKVGIFCASSLWLFFFGLLVIPPICQLQGVLSLLFVSPFAYLNDGRECYLCWVWRWDGCAVCALKCVLGNIFLLSSFHIHACTTIILAFLLTPLPS